MEQTTGKREDCFHNGLAVLTAVHQSHQDIIDSRRANDPITPEVVDSIIRDMLLFKEEQRPKALFIYYKSRRVIDEANAKTRRAQSPALAVTHDAHPRPINVKSPPLKDPPNFPPNHERHGSGESAFRMFGGSSRGSRQSHVHPDCYDETYEQGTSNAAHSPPPQPTLGQYGYSNRRDRGRSSSHDRYYQPQEAHTIHPNIKIKNSGQAAYDSDPPGDPSGVNHMAALNQPSRGRDMQSRSPQALSYSASDANEEDPSRGNARRDKSYAVASTSLTATPSGHSERNQTLNTPDLGLVAPENRKVGTQLPEMSVMEGLSLKRHGQRFPREDLFMGLKARDHVS